jgi:glycosyltransferase involved in cell wall biosynthesis
LDPVVLYVGRIAPEKNLTLVFSDVIAGGLIAALSLML